MRRVSFQVFAFTSTISLDLLQATKIEEPSAEGCAHVGEQEMSPGLGGSMPCPPVSFIPAVASMLCMPATPFIAPVGVALLFAAMVLPMVLLRRGGPAMPI